MPRNGSSVYSLPAGNPVVAGTVIATTWANTTLTDIATALTNSLSTDGSTASVSLSGKTMTGGTFSGPSVTGTMNLDGGQIAFPAVAIPSANVNTLDDYEEGTWTPTLTFVTAGNLVVAYTTRIGTYTKIGDLVNLMVDVFTSTFTHTTASGFLQITGVPFSPTVANVAAGGFLRGFNLSSVTVPAQICMVIDIAGSVIQIEYCEYNAGGNSRVATGSSATGVQKALRGTLTYKV